MHYRTDEKLYNTLNNFYKTKYNTKVFKISLNGNFTCPNLDGTLDSKGCIYCSELGSGDFAGKKTESIEKQFESQLSMIKKKWPTGKIIVYFQANTNTYSSVDYLKNLIERDIFLDNNDVIGFSLSTRSDCISDEIISYLDSLSFIKPVQLEIGLQSMHERSLIFLNRCHTLENFDNIIHKLSKYNFELVVHIINGIPHESHNDMIDTVKYLSNLPINGIKIHMLHIMKKTHLYTLDQKFNYELLNLEQYTKIVCDQLEYLREDIVVHRVTGDSPRDLLIKPTWTLKKLVVHNEIDKELRRRKTHQGFRYRK